ncbi:putative non-structural polyprotein [Lasius neglectus picorna-like virus 3]|nr:putative non-structural polyprotein [Lasius neglectus picorna-like virus 3]
MSGLFVLLSLGKFIYSCFKDGSAKKTKLYYEQTLYIDGEKVDLRLTRAGARVNVDLTCDSQINLIHGYQMCEDAIDDIIKEHFGIDYMVGTVQYTTRESDPKDQRRMNKTGKTLPTKNLRKIEPTVTTPPQANVSSTLISIQQKCYNSQCWVNGSRANCYGMRWKNRDVLTPAHIWNNVGEEGTVVTPNQVVEEGMSHTKLCQFTAMVYYLDHDNDIAVVRIKDKTCQASADITKYFHSESRMYSWVDGAILMRQVTPANRESTFHTALPMVHSGSITIRRRSADKPGSRPDRHFEFYRAQLHEVGTRPGDCGSPYIILDPSAGHQCILGMHTNILPNGRQTLGSVISQEYLATIVSSIQQIGSVQQGAGITQTDVWDVDKYFKDKNPRQIDCGVQYAMDEFYLHEWYECLTEVEDPDDIFYDAEENPEANCTLIGFDRHYNPSWRGKDSHTRTPWSHELEKTLPLGKFLSVCDPRKSADPSALKTLGHRPSLLATQIDKYNDKCVMSEELSPFVELAYEDHLAECRLRYAGHYRILTDLEAINGTYLRVNDPLYSCLEPLDLESSAGDYPARKWGVTTKTPLFKKTPIRSPSGRDIYDWSNDIKAEDVRQQCINYELYAIDGTRLIIPMKDALKREINEKQDKSRLFTVLSIQETMFGRKYSGALQAIVMANHANAHTQIGIYPLPGFNHLYDRFASVGLNGEAGDFSRWDKHTLASLIRKALEACKQMYKDHMPKDQWPVIENAWNVIADSMINSIVIADGYAYLVVRGVRSGCPLTALVNSWVNDILMYTCLRWLVDQHNQFLKKNPTDQQLLERYGKEFHNDLATIRKPIQYSMEWVRRVVDWATYGDDFVSAINSHFLWLINFKTRQQFYKLVGLDYDTPLKDGKEYTYMPVSELMFISRTFRQEAGLTFPALKKSSIESLLHWARTNNQHQWRDNIKNVLDEAVLWGEDYYNKICDELRRIILYCKQYKIEINCAIPHYKDRLNWAINTIRDTQNSAILPEPPRLKVEIERSQHPRKRTLSTSESDLDQFDIENNKLLRRTQNEDGTFTAM